MIGHYDLPSRYDDATWLKRRHELIEILSGRYQEVEIGLSDCQWMDLNPLVDLLLHCSKCLKLGVALRLSFSGRGLEPPGRVLRFLRESGFIETLNQNAEVFNVPLVYAIGSKINPSSAFQSVLADFRLAMRVLDSTTIMPCMVLNADDLTSRDDVFAYCRKLRESHVTKQKMLTLRISMPLVHELKLFFDFVLPELIDNVRLHKPNLEYHRLFAIFIRIRRREEKILGVQRLAESSLIQSTKFQKLTSHFWQHDIVEAAFCDVGGSRDLD